MASQVEVVNRALFKLGSLPLTSISDNNKQARVMSGLWDTVRRAELRRHLWSFALQRTALPALAAVPAWGFDLAYQLPADYLRLVQVNDYFISPSEADYRDSDDSAYVIEGTSLMCNWAAPLKFRYVRDITDPGAFDALFVEAMASKLAYEGCEAITQSNEKKKVAGQDYKNAVDEAARVGSIEKAPQGIPDDSWVSTRL